MERRGEPDRQEIDWLFGLALAALALALFLKLTWELQEGGTLFRYDHALILWVAHARSALLNGPAVDITALGSPTVTGLIAAGSAAVLLLLRRRLAFLQLCVALSGGSLLMILFKTWVARARPVEVEPLVRVTGYSYPSGHSILAASVYLTLALIARRIGLPVLAQVTVLAFASVVVVLVGLSRVYLGVHYPSDVVSGIALGFSWALFVSGAFRWFGRRPGAAAGLHPRLIHGYSRRMDTQDRFFKGWAKPGPVPAPAPEIQVEEGETLDALCGHFRIFQYRDGHRYSTDDVLTAWYGTLCCPTAARALDLGSGIGTVGMMAAWRLQGARFVTVEAQDISVRLARKSVRLNGLESRYEIRQGDFREPAILSPDEKFDLVTGSPPYFPLGSGILGNHPQKVACRFEVRGCVQNYCEVAARHLDWGGVFACVFPVDPVQQLERVKEGARAAGLTIVRQRNIVLREGNEPLLAVFAMMRSEHLPEPLREQTWVEPDLVIRDASGRASAEYIRVKLSMGMPPTN